MQGEGRVRQKGREMQGVWVKKEPWNSPVGKSGKSGSHSVRGEGWGRGNTKI